MSQLHYQKVFKSPINTSISKNLYSFPKTERFSASHKSPCNRSFYETKTGLTTARTTSFGFGNRSDLINRKQVPDPGQYQNRMSPFYQNQYRKKGYSFGGQLKQGFPYQDQDINNPGPGKYDYFYKTKKAFSIRNKYEDPLEKDKNMLGPGQYRVTQNLSKNGAYFNSKFKSSGCGKIGNQHRFADSKTQYPGPGTYVDRLDINRAGSYFNSRIKSNYVSSFEGTSRPSIIVKPQAPGPGTYYVFSEFASRLK